MVPGLDRLGSRFVFVMGKGGVGKTTTAGALALGMAESGEATHLISTDPAHSLSDLFRVTLPGGGPATSPCDDRLLLEEFDAEAYAAEWIRGARGPVSELLDRGTYLDPEDVGRFLDLSLPGVDEVMAALRLGDLAGEERRVVVDTAPTGHALRLLEAGEVLRSWSGALDAMEAKARAVAEGLTHREVRLASTDFLEALEARVSRFEREVLAEGEVVLVTAAGEVVAAETRRLREAVERRGMEIALRVRVAGSRAGAGADEAAHAEAGGTGGAGSAEAGEGDGWLQIPRRPDLRGCDELRRWGAPADGPAVEPSAGRAVEPATAPPADRQRPRSPRPTGAPSPLDLLDRELLLVVGKGGVGKSTCAAALALGLSERRPLTLLSTDPAGSLDEVLGTPVPPDGLTIGDLTARQVDAASAFERVRDEYRERVESVFQNLSGERGGPELDRRVIASLLQLAPPGIDEIFGLVELLPEDDAERSLVVDTAPTGHLLRLLEMPGVALEWTREAMRVLVKYRAVLGLDAFAESLLHFANRLKSLNLKLSDPARTGALVVTLPDPLVDAESRRLVARLRQSDAPVAALLRNRTGPGAEGSLPDPPEGVPVLEAPEASPEPVGPDALTAFLARWTSA